MPTTRASARASNSGSSPSKPKDEITSSPPATGSKRKAEDVTSSKAKRQERPVEKTKPRKASVEDDISDENGDTQMITPPHEDAQTATHQTGDDSKDDVAQTGSAARNNKQESPAHTPQTPEDKNLPATKDDEVDTKSESGKGSKDDTANKSSTHTADGAVDTSKERENAMPSAILEKGIIYFFTRGRVGIEDPENVHDLQRTYFVLRPLPKGARLGDGPVEDMKNNRLLALPKKVFPTSHKDRFMAFVEKADTSIEDLKENFFKGSEYETKTLGTRHTPPVAPIGEGVYAITQTEGSTHLVYMLTIPSALGEVQKDIGIESQGIFQLSVKNPERSGPAFARLPEPAKFPPEIIKEFRGLAWAPAHPKYLGYENCQVLLIGKESKESFDKALEPSHKDEKQAKETPAEELEKLEHEDELRVEHLKGDDSIYADLAIHKNDYPDMLSTW